MGEIVMEEKKYEYVYPVEELDKMIEQIEKGGIPLMNDQMQLEVKMRYNEIRHELFDDEEDEELDAETIEKHREMVNKKIEENKRKASRDDVYIMTISDDQKANIRKEMEVSIVRTNPNNAYNKRDELLYDNKERRIIYQKLSKLRNCYFNQKDYVNAIKIIKDAIEYSLEHDWPWMTKEEAIKEFNAGHIKFKYMNIPMLYINATTQITDGEILKGIISGDVVLKDRRDDNHIRPSRRKQYTPINMDYEIIGTNEYNAMTTAHRNGYDVPISVAIKNKAKTYDSSAIPSSNRFATQKTDKTGQPILFDWSRENAGIDYYNMINGKKTSVTEIYNFLNTENNGNLGTALSTNMYNFIASMKSCYNNQDGNYYCQNNNNSNIPERNEQAAQIERNLLASIKATNNNMNR